jgi:hypothetical protein
MYVYMYVRIQNSKGGQETNPGNFHAGFVLQNVFVRLVPLSTLVAHSYYRYIYTSYSLIIMRLYNGPN